VDFLLALGSAGEVQEYVALYLGTSAAAQQFAGEFITRKHRIGAQRVVAGGNEFLGTQRAAPAAPGGGGGQGWQVRGWKRAEGEKRARIRPLRTTVEAK
jgi:PERQ amino acid-rich with GYF domain-containing protein